MAALTDGSAKELLPLGGIPVLTRVLLEAREVDADRVVVVVSPDKEAVAELARDRGAEVVLQPMMRGLADAIACADVDDDAVILMGDSVIHDGSPVARMAELIHKGIDGAIAVEPTDDEGTRRYGIVDIDEWSGGVKGILEKPGPEATTSRWAVAGRYALSRRLMAFLSEAVAVWDGPGELGMTPVLNAARMAGFDLKAVALAAGASRADCGSPEEYAAARRLVW